MELTQAIIRELTDYDPETGILTWRVRDRRWFKSDANWKAWNRKYSEKSAGSPAGQELYLRCAIFGRFYRVHRIIWMWMTGDWPAHEIDHKNHDRADNRWCNLRAVTGAENKKNRPRQKNNSSGTPGVFWASREQKWVAAIKVSGKRRHLGYFTDKSIAISKRKAAEIKYGFHPNHGRCGEAA